MRDRGQILLLSTYELGHQPLGLASPLGFLARAGWGAACAALDLSVEPLDPARVRAARFIAVSVPMHTALRLGARVAARVRALNPTCHLAFHGLYAALNAEYLFTLGADAVLAGEIEEPLVRLVAAVAAARDPRCPAPVDGVTLRTDGPPARPHLARQAFAVPERDALPSLDRYARLLGAGAAGDGALAGYVEASRGCLHHCTHCPIPPVYGGRLFVVPPDVVLEDVRRQAAAGAAHVTFGDPDFLNAPTHALRLARALHGELPHLTFDFTAKVEHLLRHRAMLPELRALGCVFVVSAFESTSDLVLAHLAKGHTRADAARALQVVHAAGLALRPTFVAFTPWTTLDDYLDMLAFIDRERLVHHVDPVQYGLRLLVPPGSLLLRAPAMAPFLGPLEPERLAYRWTHPDPVMDALQSAVACAVEEVALAQPGAGGGGRAADELDREAFRRVRALARAARGLPVWPLASQTLPRHPSRVPRLTEPWFC